MNNERRLVAKAVLQNSISETWVNRLFLAVILVEGGFLRLWQINLLGYNTDEAVYAGTAAAIAGDPVLTPFFPIFRAHPVFTQFILGIIYHWGVSDLAGRLVSVAFGLAAVVLTYKIGDLLYGQRAGLLAALVLALMPMHVLVSRQFLLDGPMTTMATLALYSLARYAKSEEPRWLYATGIAMGLVFLAKETGFILFGAVYVFLALSPELRVRIRDVIISLVLMVLTISPYPISLALAKSGGAGQNYLVWQLFRRPNHDPLFYFQVVPPAINPLVLIAAALGILLFLHRNTWKEKLLLLWIAVTFIFFQLWPVKGFQYTLPIVAPLAVLAGRALGTWDYNRTFHVGRRISFDMTAVRALAIGIISIVLLISSWGQIQARFSDQFTAGTGGVPGGREAGQWVSENVPVNAKMMALGPSMGNIIQFYGHRKVYGLSVSRNPLHRNPSYEAIPNPDGQLRTGEIQYIIWDSFSASRSEFFSNSLLGYVRKYNGRVVHTQQVSVPTGDRVTTIKYTIIIYEVRP